MSIAFFDIDGTLLAKPSLERRFFRELRGQGKIPAANYFRWLAEFVRAAPRDILAATYGNKMYLRGVSPEMVSAHAANRSTASRADTLPEFFPAAIERARRHALLGDAIVLVSGTLAPLAGIVQIALERELSWRGVETRIFLLATQLEISDSHWTGEVAGAAMFGEVKAIAVREFACARGIPLAQCSAYGDSSLDRSMLASVGHPFAVNPTRRLRRIGRLRGWQTLAWTHGPLRTAAEQRALRNAGTVAFKTL